MQSIAAEVLNNFVIKETLIWQSIRRQHPNRVWITSLHYMSCRKIWICLSQPCFLREKNYSTHLWPHFASMEEIMIGSLLAFKAHALGFQADHSNDQKKVELVRHPISLLHMQSVSTEVLNIQKETRIWSSIWSDSFHAFSENGSWYPFRVNILATGWFKLQWASRWQYIYTATIHFGGFTRRQHKEHHR